MVVMVVMVRMRVVELGARVNSLALLAVPCLAKSEILHHLKAVSLALPDEQIALFLELCMQ